VNCCVDERQPQLTVVEVHHHDVFRRVDSDSSVRIGIPGVTLTEPVVAAVDVIPARDPVKRMGIGNQIPCRDEFSLQLVAGWGDLPAAPRIGAQFPSILSTVTFDGSVVRMKASKSDALVAQPSTTSAGANAIIRTARNRVL